MQELEVRQSGTVERTTGTPSVIDIIAKITDSPQFSLEAVQAIKELVALQERQDAQRRKERFEDAHLCCQKEMPRVAKNGLIDPKGAAIPYARLEDLDACIRPIYQRHGFTVTFDAPQAIDGAKIRNVARFSCAGHTETLEITAAASNRPTGRLSLTNAQAVKQTITECRRHLQEMFFNIITEGADEIKPEDPITEKQAMDIQCVLEETKSNIPTFCRLFGVAKVSELRPSQLTEVWAKIEQKRARS